MRWRDARLFDEARPIGLMIAIAIYAAAAALTAPAVFLGVLGLYTQQAKVLPLLLLIGVPIGAMITRPQAPLRQIRDIITGSFGRLALVVLFFCVGLSGFTTFKLTIPHLVPFYLDPMLADLDLTLHGANPGEVLHRLVPSWAQYPLGYLYGSLWFSLWFGLVAFVALQKDGALRQRYFWSMALAIGLIGTVLATALSSVGPVFYAQFYGSNRYAGLMTAIDQSAVGQYIHDTSRYLLANYQQHGHAIGTGISAMPSMHLAVVTLNAHMVGSLDRRLGVLAWSYVAAILAGSVYLGWHYAVDGYLSIILVSVIWCATGRLAARNAIAGEVVPVAAE
jgi:hypothetical protein